MRKQNTQKAWVAWAAILVMGLAGCSSPSSGPVSNPAQEAADAFRAQYGELLAKDTDSITADDEAAVNAALEAYEDLTDAAKSLLTAEKGRLDALKAAIPAPAGPTTGSFTYTVWPDDNMGNLLSDFPEYLDISKSLGETLTIAAAEDLSDVQWSLNGANLAAPRGTARSITIEAINYVPGAYTLSLYAEKDDVPYSTIITFTVDD
jgi:hypothetical protein